MQLLLCITVLYSIFFVDCSIPSALEAASLHPAEVIGEILKGRLDVGCDADVVFLSNDLTVHGTIIAGEIVWMSEESLLKII